MATATLNTGNKSFTVTDTIGGSTIKKVYPIGGVTTVYSNTGAAKSLNLFVGGEMVIAISDTPGAVGFGNTIFGSSTVDGVQTATEANVGAAGGGAGAAQIGDCKSGLQAADHNGWILLNGRAKSTLTAAQQAAATSLGIGTNLPDATGRGFIQGSLGQQIGSNTIAQANLPNINLSVTSTSAGTPTGSISSDSAGTPSGSASSTSAGTPAGSISSVGDHTHPYNIPYASNARFDSNQNGGSSFGSNTGYTTGNGGAHGHTFAGSALPGHAHSLSMSTLPAHSHTFTGSALPGHNHTVSLGGSGASFIPASVGVNQFIYLGNS